MRITLKKFCQDPYKTIEKSPIIIMKNQQPTYAIVPYVTYKRFLDERSTVATPEQAIAVPINTEKQHGRLWRLFFS